MARPEVLSALPGVSQAEVEAIRAARAAEAEGGAPIPAPPLTEVRRYTTRSRDQVFTIRAEARTQTGAVFVREAVVRLMDMDKYRPFRIFAWRRGRRSEAVGALGVGGATGN